MLSLNDEIPLSALPSSACQMTLAVVQKAEPDGDASEAWVCRALELEKRTRDVVTVEGDRTRESVEEQMQAVKGRVDQIDAAVKERFKEMNRTLETRVEALLSAQLREIRTLLEKQAPTDTVGRDRSTNSSSI